MGRHAVPYWAEGRGNGQTGRDGQDTDLKCTKCVFSSLGTLLSSKCAFASDCSGKGAVKEVKGNRNPRIGITYVNRNARAVRFDGFVVLTVKVGMQVT